MNILKKLCLPIWNVSMNFWQKKVRKLSHQRLDMVRTREKWALMEPLFRGGTGKVLDLGCNEGFFSLQAADMGWQALGLDLNENAIDYANKAASRAGKQDDVSYRVQVLSPEVLAELEQYDAVLMLSMFQEIYFHQGRESAMAVLGSVFDLCRDFVVFETATTNIKYSETDVLFDANNDQEAITRWVESLAKLRLGWEVRYYGKTAYTNEEPYRLMFIFERKAA